MSKSSYYSISVVSLILASIFYFFQVQVGLVVVLMLYWVYCLLYSLKKIDGRIAFFSFLITFFSFLLSRLFIDTLLPGFSSDYTVNVLNKLPYSRSAEPFVFYALIVSLTGLSFGFLRNSDNVSKVTRIENPLYLDKIRLLSRRLAYLFFAFTLVVTIEKIRYIWANGYIDFYLNYKEGLPHIFYTLAAAYKFAFFIFLSTIPSKRESKPLIYLYLFEACISLLTGQRGAFVTPLLFILIYLFFRNSLSPEDPWISRKGKLAIAVSLPIFCALMFLVMLIRADNGTGNDSILTLFLNFFYQLGGSEKIIGYAYDYQSSVPDGQWYSLGPIIRFFQGNPISLLFGGEAITTQSVEMATRGHELGSFLTYNTDEYRYLSGGNIASSYVAELWLDFGFIGVFIGSFIYGKILGSIVVLSCTNVWKTTIAFIMINRILTAPRANYMLFLTDCLSFSFLIMIIYILFECKGIPRYINSKKSIIN